MKERELYFIAIMLPQAVDEEIVVFKNDMALRFKSKKALRTASHITLKAPFKVPVAQYSEVLQWFTQLNITVAPFIQEIKDFGAFNNRHNPVIFVKPVMNASLQQLQKEVVQQFIPVFPKDVVGKHELTFSPHITIGYRDLLTHQFKAAWQEYADREYAASFIVNSFQLLQHIDGRWVVISSYSLGDLQ